MEVKNFDKKKFHFSETFTNENGKTSGSGFVGVLLGLSALVGFFLVLIGWFLELPGSIELMTQIAQLFGISAILMGIRKGVEGLVKRKKQEQPPRNVG